MADQDFNIKVVTTADTSGIQKTTAELAKLRQESLRAALSPVPAGLGGAETASKVYPKLAVPIPAVTDEEANAFGQSFSNKISHGLTRFIGHALGIGVILEFVSSLKNASAEISKISDALNNQGEQLAKHAELYDEQARHAKDLGDVLKVSDATLKDIETAQKTLNDLSTKDLGIAAKISDYLQVQLLARQKIAGIGDYEAAQAANMATAVDQLNSARQRGMDELIKAEDAANTPIEERITLLQNEISVNERLKQSALDQSDPGGYAKAGNNLTRLNKELEDTIKLQAQKMDADSKEKEANEAEREKDKEFVQKQVDRASPQARAILQNEQAAQKARDEGRERDADMFQKNAERFRQSATPQQQQETAVLEKLIEQNGLLREILNQFR